MAGYTTGAPELQAAAKEMESGNADLMQQLSQLASSVEGVSGAWQGAAATAFHSLMARFSEDAKKLNDSLVQISEQVAGSATAYQAQEEQAQQSLSSITNTLGG